MKLCLQLQLPLALLEFLTYAGDNLQDLLSPAERDPGLAAVVVSCNGAGSIPGEAKSRISEEHTGSVVRQSCTHPLTPVLVLGESSAATRINKNVLISPCHLKACLLLSPVRKPRKETVKLPLSYTFSPFSSPIPCLHRRPRFGSDRAAW